MENTLEKVLHILIDRVHFSSESERNNAHEDIRQHFASEYTIPEHDETELNQGLM